MSIDAADTFSTADDARGAIAKIPPVLVAIGLAFSVETKCGMSDEPKKRSRRWIGWALAFLVAYPLLAGPSAWIIENTHSFALLQIRCLIFAPLNLVRDQSEVIDNACRRYIHLWVRYEPGVMDDGQR
jgi:hypothetical protein